MSENPVRRKRVTFSAWCKELVSFAMRETETTPDLTESYWKDCFNDGMSPEQAFHESFVEEDGL